MSNFGIDRKERRAKLKIHMQGKDSWCVQFIRKLKELGAWTISGFGQKVYGSSLKMNIDCQNVLLEKKNTFAKSSRQDDILCGNQQKFLLHKLTGYDRRNRGCIDLTQSITQQSDFVTTTARVHLLYIYRCIFQKCGNRQF